MEFRSKVKITDTFFGNKDTNQRGIIVSGWVELEMSDTSENIFISEPLPYNWLPQGVKFRTNF